MSRLDWVRLYQKPIHPLAHGRKMPTRMPAKSIRAQPHLSYLMSSARRMSLIAAIPANQPFTVSVGAAVPQQVPLKQIPTDLASALNGFQGDN